MNRQSNQRIVIEPGHRVLIVGLGLSGLSAARFCHQLGATVAVSDAQPLEKISSEKRAVLSELDAELECGAHSWEFFKLADLILVSPGVPPEMAVLERAREHGIAVFGEMALAATYLKTPMVAVTGTNGKTTVTSLLGDIFKACKRKVFVGGNIGAPLTDYLQGSQDADLVVLEISSFQLDTAPNFHPKVAVLLNISPDHLDRYPSYMDYAESKMSIFVNQSAEDVSIVNGDDKQSMELVQNLISLRHGWAERSAISFGKQLIAGHGAVLAGQKVKLINKDSSGKDSESACFGLAGTRLEWGANPYNAMAAILAAKAMGCDDQGIQQGLASYQIQPHRLEPVTEIAGVSYIDDSKATNVGAVKTALEGMIAPVVLIAGGLQKGGDFTALIEAVVAKVKHLILIGQARDEMAKCLKDLVSIEFAETMADAVSKAQKVAEQGDVVLLSPACASFDMFNSYKHRGQTFSRAVLDLG